MTNRIELDEYCLAQTLAMGAEFKVIDKIIEIIQHETHITLNTSLYSFNCNFLIGADGANSQVRKLTGDFKVRTNAFAIETKVHLNVSKLPEMEFDFGVIDKGYGWLFPKKDHVNVGLYTNSKDSGISKKMLMDFIQFKLGSQNFTDIIGYPVGIGGWNYLPKTNRILLVGDAAGFCEPLLGEGIYYAIKSGQLAALSIGKFKNNPAKVRENYEQNLESLRKDLKSGYKSMQWFNKFFGFGYWFLTFVTTRKILERGFAKGLSFRETKQKAWSLLFNHT